MKRRQRRGWVVLLIAWCAPWLVGAPAVFRTAPGQFEVSAPDATVAQAVTAAAEEAWRALTVPLALPEAFSSPVFVRLVPAAEWAEPAAFRTVVEPGGVVSVLVPFGGPAAPRDIHRALVQSLLLRIAVARHGVSANLTCPLWLEVGCVGWWETRFSPAQLDRLKQESRAFAAPALRELLQWQRGAPEPAAWEAGALWLLTFFQAESTRAGEWPTLLGRLLAGDDPTSALAASFPGHPADAAEWELWWSTGFHHVRRLRSTPGLDAVESRGELEALARFVTAEGDNDTILPLATALAHGAEPFVAAELERRRVELRRLAPALHPFFRNAGLSLADAMVAGPATPAQRDAAVATFARDWADALELTAASAAVLDRMERAGRAAP